MFSLLFGLFNYLFSKAEFHILILGVDKAGKTTLLEKVKSSYSDYEGLPPDRVVPTVGLNIGRVEVQKARLIFWDLGGQTGLRSIWEKYYEEAHAILYVVDAAAPNRFEDTKRALEKVLQHQDLVGAPILVLANKQDLDGAFGVDELSSSLEISGIKDRPCLVKGVCALDGSGVPDGLSWLVEAMRKSHRVEALQRQGGSRF